MLDMFSHTTLEHQYPQYSYDCSSMISIHPKDGSSVRDTRILLISADVVSGLIKCC